MKRSICHMRWLRFHFKRELVTGLGQYIDFEYFLLSISITWHFGMNKAVILLTINKVLKRLNKDIKWVVMFNNIYIIQRDI